MSLIAELKRRNVFRVAAAYAVIAWLLAQVADVAFDAFGAPDWVPKSVLLLLILGLPVAVLFAWAFEMTPEGVKREKDVDRTQSITSDTGRKLNRLTTAVLVAAVGFLLVDKFMLQDAPEATESEPVVIAEIDKSVAVLPFVAMSNGPDDEYFADGLTEEILNSLAQLPDLLVTARTSAFAFKGQDRPIPEIADTLGVANVVEGSVRRAGERLRITAQLIRAADGFHLWSETYERSGEDAFGVQDEIAEKIATALDVVLDDEQLAQMRAYSMRDPEAFIAYQKGLELYSAAHEFGNQEQVDMLAQANVFIEQALALEPNSSWAHFNHADYFVHKVLFENLSPAEVDSTLAAAKKSLSNSMRTAANESDRLSVALELALISEEWSRLPGLFQAAATASDCIAPSWWGGIGVLLPDLEAAEAVWRNANACDPLGFYPWANLTGLHALNGNTTAALEAGLKGMQLVPHEQIAGAVVMAYMSAGQLDEALAASLRLVESAEERLTNRISLAAARNDADEAIRLRDELVSAYGSDLDDVILFARLGDRDRANRAAAKEDASPLGAVSLMDIVGECRCGAPFDLEVTPNFARMVEDAGLLWPPRSPIEWPMKDW